MKMMLCLASRHDCIERETDPDRDCFRSGNVHATEMERQVNKAFKNKHIFQFISLIPNTIND